MKNETTNKSNDQICVRCYIYGRDLPGIPSDDNEYIKSLINPLLEDRSVLWCKPHWEEQMNSTREMYEALLSDKLDEYLDQFYPSEEVNNGYTK